jgi:predicted NBD/HSP70 family sugar kinase
MNEAVILGVIHDRGPIARTEIAAVTSLSPATVTGITQVLIGQGLVFEQEVAESTGGRPPVLLSINRDAGCVVGIKLTESQVIAALTDLGADTLISRTIELGSDRSPEAVIEQIAGVVGELTADFLDRQFYGIGIGLAGAIDRRAGICRFSPFLHWRDVPLRALLERRIGCPVVIENDVSALTLAERWFGLGAGMTDFVVVTLGRGVGLGMVLDGRLYRGGKGAGGEFGHLSVDANGPLCDCGKRGCLEALVGEQALTHQIADAFGPEVSLAEGANLARSGEATAQEIFNRAGEILGIALASIVNLLNPTRVIVGGEGVHSLDLLLDPMRSSLETHCFDGLYDDLELIVEPWGDDAWARGAAGLVLDELFHARLERDVESTAVSANEREGTRPSPTRTAPARRSS